MRRASKVNTFHLLKATVVKIYRYVINIKSIKDRSSCSRIRGIRVEWEGERGGELEG